MSLNNIANNFSVDPETQDDFTIPSFVSGLRYAILLADALIPRNTARHLHISAFNNPKDSGLFFSAAITRQCVKVMSHPVDGCVMMYLGTADDFEFPSRQAKDNLEPICFEEHEISHYADVAAKHLASKN